MKHVGERTGFTEACEDDLKSLAGAIVDANAANVGVAATALLVKVLTGSSIAAGAAEKAAARAFGRWFADTPDARLLKAAAEFAQGDRDREALQRFAALVEPRVQQGLRSVHETLARVERGQMQLSAQLGDGLDVLSDAMWSSLDAVARLEAGQDELRALLEHVGELVASSARVRSTTGRAPARPIFLTYSHKDVAYRDALRSAVRSLEERGLVSLWHDAEVEPGEPWAQRIREQLEGARLVIALVSPDFLASPWCVSELGRAFELRDRQLLDVVPVIVRQCAWRETRLGAIQPLPAGGAPLETIPDPDAAWGDVIAGLERLLCGERMEAAIPSRDTLVRHWAETLEADERLMLLAPWRGGLEETAQEIARRAFGDNVTTLRIPVVESIDAAHFYAELSGDETVQTARAFRQWLIHRCETAPRRARHLVVLPYFGGPQELVKELGVLLRGVFEQTGRLSLLTLGRARCAALLKEVQSASLFSGIVKEHVPGLDLEEVTTMLQRLGADPQYAPRVHRATGGHPEWTRLCAPEARQGRLDGLAQHLSDRKLFGVLRDRLVDLDRERQGVAHAAATLEKLLDDRPVVRLTDASDDLSYPEVRLYYDGILVERGDRTEFRCPAARIAAERALQVWRRQ